MSVSSHDPARDVVTPIAWWQAVALSLLFAIAPSPLLSMLAGLVGKLRGISFAQALEQVTRMPLALALVSLLSAVPPLWLARQRLPAPSWRQLLAWRPVPLRVIAVAVVSGAALQLPLSEVSNLVELWLPIDPAQKRAIAELLSADGVAHTLALLVSLAVAAPLAEEAVFRAVLLRGLRRVHGVTLSIVWSSALFGLAHLALKTSVLPAALAGVACALLTLRFGSIVPSIALHAAVNATPVLVTRARMPIAGFNTFDPQVQHISPLWTLPSLLIAMFGLRWLLTHGDKEDSAL